VLGKIFNNTNIRDKLLEWRDNGKKIVFTNGCFDLLHRGHVEYLEAAKNYGDILIIGLNSDNSVRRLKGKPRPYISENDRAYILSQLHVVDAVIIFNEETPLLLIKLIKPDVLVKGADYKKDEIVGSQFVDQNGGKVVRVPLVPGRSTTDLINLIRHTKD
jgi:D-beta-D-heptose 7-phosphate kinase/D-beta-D-heptose 1-phosphate adenosyltransferase